MNAPLPPRKQSKSRLPPELSNNPNIDILTKVWGNQGLSFRELREKIKNRVTSKRDPRFIPSNKIKEGRT